MIKTISKNRHNFIIMFFLLFTVSKAWGLTSFDEAYMITAIAAAMFWCLAVVSVKYTRQEMILCGFLMLVSGISMVCSGKIGAILPAMAIIALKNEKTDRIVRFICGTWGATMIIKIVFVILGVVPNDIWLKDTELATGAKTYKMGYLSPNLFCLTIVITIIYMIYTRWNEVNAWWALTIIIVSIISFKITYCFTGTIIMLVLSMLCANISILKGHKYFLKKYRRFINIGIAAASTIPLILSIALLFIIRISDDVASFLYKYTGHRANVSRSMMDAYPLTLFGQAFDGRLVYEMIDNAYIYILLQLGIIMFTLFIAGYAFGIFKMLKAGDTRRLAITCIFLYYGFTEQFIINPFMNFSLMFLAELIFAKSTNVCEEAEDNADENRKKYVCIIGAKGFGNYGGYETFVDKLTEYSQDNEKIQYIIACKANGYGSLEDETLEGSTQIGKNEFLYHNAIGFRLKVPQIGPAQAVVYDVLAAIYAIRYFRKNNIEKPILYILTCRIGIVIKWIARAMHDMDGEYYLNPDGHEYLRGCWSAPIRRYWKYSEKQMVRYADKVICDSKNIETYIQANFEQFEPDTEYISYGSELGQSELDNAAEKVKEWYESNGVKPGEYYLIVGRFVRENNYRTIFKEFMKTGTTKDLVVISDVKQYYYDELIEETDFTKDSRIKLVGTVFDQELLKKIRENAYAYIHGHSVGGTNPSLLEAMGHTNLNLLFDVGFNKECARNSALYWTKKDGNLSKLIEKCEKFDEKKITEYGKAAKKRIEDDYRWEYIVSEYDRVFLG